jgi:hypothetical protein
MISDDEFHKITRKHLRALMEDVHRKGGASAYQWTKQFGNMTVSTLMTLTDKMNLPRREIMDHLVDDLIQWIIEQKEFQVKYDGMDIEDVKKDFKNVK